MLQSYNSRLGETAGLFVLSVENYLKCQWPGLPDVYRLYQSMADSVQELVSLKSVTSSYLPKDQIQEKLKKVANN